jgi:hypothetical protein
MTVKTGQVWAGVVAALGTAGGTAALTGGTATLYVNGTANAAAVALGTAYPYSWTVTLPVLTAGQSVSMYVAGTVDSTWTGSVVREDDSDTARISEVKTDTAAILTGVTLNTSILSPVGGTATGNGAADGTTLVDTTRTEATDYFNNLAVQITSGANIGLSRTIKAYTNGTGFTVFPAFPSQVLSGVTYRVISAVVYQPGISVVKNHPAIVEPDNAISLGISLVTNAGRPLITDLTVGTITITRIRGAVSTEIVSAAACTAYLGNIFYSYTFPAASWAAGDLYQAVMTGQYVTVNGIVYALSAVVMDGRVTREVAIKADTAAILLDTGTDGVLIAAAGTVSIADAVWDEMIAGHVDAGSTGKKLTDASAAGDPWSAVSRTITGGTVTAVSGLTATTSISAAQAATVATGALALRTYHTFSQAITSTSTAALNTATKLWLAIKREHEDADSASIAFIEVAGGLTYLAGAAYATTTNGSLTVTGSSGAWVITAKLEEAATALLTAYIGESLVAECKALISGDTVSVWDGTAAISGGIVRAYV